MYHNNNSNQPENVPNPQFPLHLANMNWHQQHPVPFWTQNSQMTHQMVPSNQHTATSFGVKRPYQSTEEEASNKENQQPYAKRFQELPVKEEKKENEEEDEDEDEEDEEEDESRSTKSSSSAENEDASTTQGHGDSSMAHPTPRAQVTPQVQHQNGALVPLNMGNPLAQSTPYLGTLSLNSFQQPAHGNTDFWTNQAALHQMSSHLAMTAGGHSGQRTNGQQHTGYYPNPYLQQQQQQQLMTVNFPNAPMLPFHGMYPSFLHQSSTFNSTFDTERDSGLGVAKAKDAKNESGSSTSGSDESAAANANGLGAKELLPAESKFPPFLHRITVNGQDQIRDLETVEFGEIPPRLALLNLNRKYKITLAEVCRRLTWPEHLNTSYLSGILRKAKNTNAGKELRNRVASYGCGIDLKTGRRKASTVTTFTTLCEREAIQMAEDFGKLTADHFPHQEIALEINKKTVQSPEQARQQLTVVQSSSQILREAIEILQQGIEQETLPTTDGLERTLDSGIKNFARLSHCFGNRAVVVAWQTLLSVFAKCEQSLCQEGMDGAGPSTSLEAAGVPGTPLSGRQYDQQQQQYALLQKLRKQKKDQK